MARLSTLISMTVGTGLWVANRDEKFRGTMEYERKGYRQSFGWEFPNKNANEVGGA